MTQFNERVTIYQYMDATMNHQNKAEIERRCTHKCHEWVYGFPPNNFINTERPWNRRKHSQRKSKTVLRSKLSIRFLEQHLLLLREYSSMILSSEFIYATPTCEIHIKHFRGCKRKRTLNISFVELKKDCTRTNTKVVLTHQPVVRTFPGHSAQTRLYVLVALIIQFLHLILAHSHKSSGKSPFSLNIKKNWLNVLAFCATVLGLSTTIYFIFYTNSSEVSRPPIVFGRNYDSDTCKLSMNKFIRVLNRKHVEVWSASIVHSKTNQFVSVLWKTRTASRPLDW